MKAIIIVDSYTSEKLQERKAHTLFGIGMIVILVFFGSGIPSGLLTNRQAFADGLAEENLPPEIIQNRQVSLFVKISPVIITNELPQDTFLQFRLFDFNTNETIKFATLLISVSKGVDPSARPLINDTFQSESGILTLKLNKLEKGDEHIHESREPVFNAIKADSRGTVNLSRPLLLDGGIYHIHVDVLGTDSPTNVILAKDVKSFETFLSIGSVVEQDVMSPEGENHQMSIVSYYDKVHDIRFDSISNTYSWAIPFDWNASRIQSAEEIFVHEEVRIPKSFGGVGDVNSFNATLNGKPISSRMLLVDPFSDEQNLILHFIINKYAILEMAEKDPPHNSQMTFSFRPDSESREKTSDDIATDNGAIHVLLKWYPQQVFANADAVLAMQFVDTASGSNITADVKYDLKIFDKDDKEIITMMDHTAKGGNNFQILSFPEDGVYRIELTVKGLIKQDHSLDLTVNGIARGTVIVVLPPFSL